MSQNSPQRWFQLEEQFFAHVDQDLLARLRDQLEEKQNAESIMKVTGISDEKVANEIAALDVTPETLSAFRLAPLVAVAWADDRVEENERYVILQAAEKSGLKAGDPALELLKSWTERRPPHDLLESWCDYARTLVASINGEQREALKGEVMKQVKDVAEAAGGFLKFGSVSPSEKATIERVEAALS